MACSCDAFFELLKPPDIALIVLGLYETLNASKFDTPATSCRFGDPHFPTGTVLTIGDLTFDL